MKLTYQQELIAMVIKNPILLKGDTFDSGLLPKEYKELYEFIKGAYERYDRFDLEMLSDIESKIDIFDVSEWVESVDRCDVIDYKHLKMILIDKAKKENISQYYERLNSGMIDVVTFTSAVNLIKDNESTTLKRFKELDFKTFMSKRDTRIKFKDFKQLEKNGNINEGDFVILAGATGTGKTTLAINLALDLAYNYPIIYINIELSQDTLMKRMIGAYTNTSMNTIDNRFNAPQYEIDKMKAFGKFVEEHEIYVATGSQTVEKIQEIVSSFKQDKHYIVIIDHIGRITSDKDSYERMTQTSIAIRNLALDYNCTVLGLCQLNRGFKREKEPNNALLRDSGEVEQSARKVMFIWDYVDENNPGANGYYLWFTKNDSGKCGAIPIYFDKETQRIREEIHGNIRID